MLRFFSKIRKARSEYRRAPPGEPCLRHYLLRKLSSLRAALEQTSEQVGDPEAEPKEMTAGTTGGRGWRYYDGNGTKWRGNGNFSQ
jgi:hypothetical protein